MLWFRRINLLALILCFTVVVFGAYVRLSDAGLGCPDWPGCYGHLTVTAAQVDTAAGQNFPSRPVVEAPKAWKEMIHRYLVGGLGSLIAALAVMALLDRSRRLPRVLPFLVAGVVIVQAVFGALTVTLKLNPLIVTTHLLLGLTTLALLWVLWLRGRPGIAARSTSPVTPVAARSGLRWPAALALTLVCMQIFLGGWTSTNYAALACPDFPSCQGSLLPRTGLGEAFTLWHGRDVNYEYGILDAAARGTIQLVHRYGALMVTLVVGGMAVFLIRRGAAVGGASQAALPRRMGWALLAALLLQVAIGIGLVELQLPMWLADAHNAGAALLLLTVVALNYFAWRAPSALAR